MLPPARSGTAAYVFARSARWPALRAPQAFALACQPGYRWLEEASRPASPAFKTVRETRRLTRLLSWLPLVTRTARSGLCCSVLSMNRIMAVAMQQREVRPSVVLPVPILVMPFDQVVSRQKHPPTARAPAALLLE